MSKIHFLNIDLEIESTIDITPIIDEWGERVSVHRHEEIDGVHYGSFETGYIELSDIFEEYISLVEGLSRASREIWDKASRRDFDFGYESGTTPSDYHSRIELKHLENLAKIGGSLVITIYPLAHT